MSEIRGFASAQRQWENMEPSYAAECECPPLFECTSCGETLAKGEVCEGEGCTGVVDMIPREDSTIGAVASCPIHGWCTGCSSRNCEDCNG